MSRHAIRTTFLALFTLFLPLLVVSAPPSLEDVIPADAVIVILVDDLPGLRHELPNSPLMRAWEDPAIRAAFLRFSDMEELPDLPAWLLGREESGGGSDDPHAQLLNSLTGQLALMLDLQSLDHAHPEGEHLPAGFSLLAQIESHEKTVTDLLSTAAVHEGSAESAGAMTLPAGTWKIARGVLAISGTPAGAEALAAALEGAGAAAPLSSGAGFQTMRRHAAGGDVELLVNLVPVVAMAQQALTAEEGGMQENPLGIAPQDLLRGLGLDVLRSMWFSLRLSPAVTESAGGITFTEERGLVHLAAFRSLPAGQRLPLPAEAVDATTYGFDFAAAWKAAVEITTEVSPVIGAALEAQVAQMSAQLNIDLGKEIPGAFAGQFASATFLHPLPSGAEIGTLEEFTKNHSQVWVAQLNPENRLEEALSTLSPLLAATGMTASTRTVDGQLLHILEAAADPETIIAAWAIHGGYLVAGNGRPEDLVTVLAGLTDGGPGIWGTRKVQKALGALSEDAFAIEYQDTGRLMKGYLSALLAALPAEEDGGMEPDEAEQLAEALARLIPVSVSGGYRSAGELLFKARALHGTP